MNPPIAEAADQAALIQGLVDGTLDAVATDHAPHSRREKEMEFALAAPGISGLETSLSLVLTTLVTTGKLSLLEALRRMTEAPAKILKISKGTLAPGVDADIVIFDPEAERTIQSREFVSQSNNTPFDQWKVKGRVLATFVGGKLVFSDPAFAEKRL